MQFCMPVPTFQAAIAAPSTPAADVPAPLTRYLSNELLVQLPTRLLFMVITVPLPVMVPVVVSPLKVEVTRLVLGVPPPNRQVIL